MSAPSPILGYNLKADNGLSGTTVTIDTTIWNTTTGAAAGKSQVYAPAGTYLFSGKNNFLQNQLHVKGEGNDMTIFQIANGWAGTSSDQVFQSNGRSEVTFEDITFSGKTPAGTVMQMHAFFRMNSYGDAGGTTICKNVRFIRCKYVDIWGYSIRLGDTEPTDSHYLENFVVFDCDFDRICNPALPVITDDEPADGLKCHALNLAQTTRSCYIGHNRIRNCSGDAIRANGWSQSTDKIAPYPGFGNWLIEWNTIENVWMGMELIGNGMTNGSRILNNTIINPTRRSGFGLSIDGAYMTTDGNKVYTYNNRGAFEYKGVHSTYGNDMAWISNGDYAGFNTTNNTKPSSPQTSSYGVLCYGYNNTYDTKIRFENVASNVRRRGFVIVGKPDSPTSQPQSWDGASDYAFGFHFRNAEVYQTNGPMIDADDAIVSTVLVSPTFKGVSQYQTETVIRNWGPNWIVDNPFIDLTGSPNPTGAAALFGLNTNKPLKNTNSTVRFKGFNANWKQYFAGHLQYFKAIAQTVFNKITNY